MFPNYSLLWNNVNLKLKVIWLFYRSMVFYQSLFSIVCLILLYRLHHEAYGLIFWTKLVGYASSTYFTFIFRQNEFCFYQNLGFSRRTLFSGAFLLDFLLLCLCLVSFFFFYL